jgi:hypothetical protein
MNVIPLDASLVRGSHGRITDRLEDGPVVLSSEKNAFAEPVGACAIRDLILSHVFDDAISNPI